MLFIKFGLKKWNLEKMKLKVFLNVFHILIHQLYSRTGFG